MKLFGIPVGQERKQIALKQQFETLWAEKKSNFEKVIYSDSYRGGILGEIRSLLHSGAATHLSCNEALDLYNNSSAVSIPVNIIAEAFSDLDIVLEINGDPVDSHPVLELLDYPSSHFSKTLLMKHFAVNRLVTGNSYLIFMGNIARPPIAIEPVSCSHVSIAPDGFGLPAAFHVTDRSHFGSYQPQVKVGRTVYVSGSQLELARSRTYSTLYPMLEGDSPLLPAVKEARQHIQGIVHNLALLQNGGSLTLAWLLKAAPRQEVMDQFKEDLERQFMGASNAGRMAVLGGNAEIDVKELGVNNKDMDFVNMHTAVKQAIALVYKVPLPLIGMEGASYNNVFEAKLGLYDNAVLPLANVLLEDLGKVLLPRFGIDPKTAKLCYNKDAIPALKQRRMEELEKRKNIGIETINELRASMSLDPQDGGDVVYIAAGMVPLGFDEEDDSLISDLEAEDQNNQGNQNTEEPEEEQEEEEDGNNADE